MDQKKDQQNVTFVGGIMTITLEYRYARIKIFNQSAPKELENIPLYISFEENLINFLNNTAFLSSYNCIPLMKSEEQLKQLLTELWDSPSPCMNPRFPSLTPGLLWCAVIYRLIDKGLEKIESLSVDSIKCVGIFISYPDLADTSLKKLIINAVRNYDEQHNQEKKIGIKVFPNSRGAAARWPYFDRVNLSQNFIDSYKQEFRGYLVYEINTTEFYLTLGRMKNGIVVGKGKINIGMNSSFREVLKLANERNGKLQYSIKPIEEWDHRLKQFLEDIETSLSSFNSNAETVNFEDMDKKKQPVKKAALVKAIEEDMEEISKMVLNTIQETIEKLTNLDILKLNGYTFDLKNLSHDKYICVLIRNKNDGFLENKLNSKKISTLIFNEFGDTLGNGCTYFARGFLSRLTKSKTDNHTNFILGDEVTICELIQANRFLIKDKKDNEITTFPREPILSTELIPIGTELEKYVEYRLYDTFNLNDKTQSFYIGKFTLLHEGNVYIQLNKYLANLLPRVEYDDPQDQYNELDSDLIFLEEEINKNEKKYKQYIREGEIQEEFISFGKYPDILLELIDKISSDEVECRSIKSAFGKLKTYTPLKEKQIDYYYTKEKEICGIPEEEKADFEKFPSASVYNDLLKDYSYTTSGDPIIFREKILEFWKPLVMRMDRINVYLTKNNETSQMYKPPKDSMTIINRYKELIEESKENKEAKENK